MHVHSLHTHTTGQVLRVLDRGTSSIQDIMSVVLFNVVPQAVDVAAACAYMAVALQAWIAGIVLATVVLYVLLTVYVTEWRGRVRKQMNQLDNAKEAKATDMLLNYEVG